MQALKLPKCNEIFQESLMWKGTSLQIPVCKLLRTEYCFRSSKYETYRETIYFMSHDLYNTVLKISPQLAILINWFFIKLFIQYVFSVARDQATLIKIRGQKKTQFKIEKSICPAAFYNRKPFSPVRHHFIKAPYSTNLSCQMNQCQMK